MQSHHDESSEKKVEKASFELLQLAEGVIHPEVPTEHEPKRDGVVVHWIGILHFAFDAIPDDDSPSFSVRCATEVFKPRDLMYNRIILLMPVVELEAIG